MIVVNDLGRSPRGSGSRPAGRASKAVSPVPASILNAVRAVQQFIEKKSGVQVRLDDTHTADWKSLTFTGQRATSSMWADDTASALKPVLEALADAEFAIPDEIIADVAYRDLSDVPTFGGCSFTVEVLSVDE